MLSLVASVISEVEDKFTDVFRLFSLSQEWINCLSLCNLGKPKNTCAWLVRQKILNNLSVKISKSFTRVFASVTCLSMISDDFVC